MIRLAGIVIYTFTEYYLLRGCSELQKKKKQNQAENMFHFVSADFFGVRVLKMGIHPHIQLSGCEIIRNRISPRIADVGYPVVRGNIANL